MNENGNANATSEGGDIRSKLSSSIFKQLGDQNRFKPDYKPPAKEEQEPQTPASLEQPSDEGTPAPAEEGSSDTPTTSSVVEDSPSVQTVIDENGQEVEVQYVYDDTLAEGEERVEYIEVDDTTEASGDDDSTLENGVFYMDASNPQGTVYKTAEDAKRGIRQKDEYINKLEAQLKDVDQLNDSLKMYQSYMPPEALKELVVQSYMPEEFQGIQDDEITDEAQLKLLRKARIDAEVKLERELAEIDSNQAEVEKQQLKRQQDAQKFMETVESDNFFGIQNPEDRTRLSAILNTPIGETGINASTVALMLHEGFGPDVATDYLLGLKSKFWKDVNKNVKKKVKRIVTRPKSVVVPEKPQPTERPKANTTKGKLVNGLNMLASQRK